MPTAGCVIVFSKMKSHDKFKPQEPFSTYRKTTCQHHFLAFYYTCFKKHIGFIAAENFKTRSKDTPRTVPTSLSSGVQDIFLDYT